MRLHFGKYSPGNNLRFYSDSEMSIAKIKKLINLPSFIEDE